MDMTPSQSLVTCSKKYWRIIQENRGVNQRETPGICCLENTDTKWIAGETDKAETTLKQVVICIINSVFQ